MNNTNIFIRKMFNAIAPKYDFLNRLLSLGQDIYWRKIMAASVGGVKNLLDTACGTGDVAFEIAKRYKKIKIYGTDFSEEMLLIAQKKKDITDYTNLFFVAADALLLPFENNHFDVVTIAFGIRNIEDKKRVLTEFIRVLKPGGSVLILELTAPENRFFMELYMLYFKKILPLIGGLFSKNFQAYKYLPDSVMKFPKTSEFVKMMEKFGFKNIRIKKLSLGVATLFTGYKN
ncbi:MAG: bifunctional demethylmenaquinone methyltransferase/2-methoxy-6-polyprenyl-1,4-benzoquinol methylase UbiE [Deltaproteobacteria bacterium]|nr:bifunctional demethylmenaquinone methyltransferase/2-methoxy-6-polyprenyl-1,4-benzoquinol methylase UbiE [Deltaproteobacteria bacterium]